MVDRKNILEVKNLSVSVQLEHSNRILIDDITFSVEEKTITAIVGGSGSGKTTTGLSIMRLLAPALNIDKGEIIYNGDDLLAKTDRNMQSIRGKEISMVFQEPLNAFNPVFTIGYQLKEVIKYHLRLSAKNIKEKVLYTLDTVGLPDPEKVSSMYPHQLSGGMRQRAMIAQAIILNPRIIIADEPTSNLDVTLQARIMELFLELKNKLDLTVILITHDLGMVSHLADNIKVMTEGRIVEDGVTSDIINNPKAEYTKILMRTMF